jgi:SAM-dependent methyltransferase
LWQAAQANGLRGQLAEYAVVRSSADVESESDALLAHQIEYYRRRASEYDETSIEDLEAGERLFGELIERLAPSGDVLEIACGTGLWTQHLAPRAGILTALDSSPEMVELARARTGDGPEFVVADVFEWDPPRSYDSIFFGFFLSHVPPARLADFWRLLHRSLAANGGRVLFVDEGPPRAPLEPDLAGDSSGTAKRRLRDGSLHTLVKVFYDPEELTRTLAGLGWTAEIELTSEGLIVGTVRLGS